MTILTKKPSAEKPHISQDEGYKQWCEALKARGVHPVIMWEMASPNSEHTDVYFVVFNGAGFQPAILTALVQWYGPRDGFAVYLPSTLVSNEREARSIAGGDDVAGDKHFVVKSPNEARDVIAREMEEEFGGIAPKGLDKAMHVLLTATVEEIVKSVRAMQFNE